MCPAADAGGTAPKSKLSRRRTPAAASGRGGGSSAGRNPSVDTSPGRGGSADAESMGSVPISPESAAALAAEALTAVKASLALPQPEHYRDSPSAATAGGGGDGGARELRVALARAIGALRNACVGAASSTAELLGGEAPTGFAQASQVALAWLSKLTLYSSLDCVQCTHDDISEWFSAILRYRLPAAVLYSLFFTSAQGSCALRLPCLSNSSVSGCG